MINFKIVIKVIVNEISNISLNFMKYLLKFFLVLEKNTPQNDDDDDDDVTSEF